MIKQLLKAVMTMALFLSVILGYAETTEGKMFYGLPTYTVGNYMYAVHEFGKSYDILPKYKNSSIYKYTGAILIPNLDKSVKYSGKITIPERVIINGTEYPVFGFMWLSVYPENESEDLEIVLPERLKVLGFNGNFSGGRNTIKAINIPKTVEYIGAMKYIVPGATVTIPSAVKEVEYDAGLHADNLIIEDGAHTFRTYSIGCGNKSLTIPGSVQFSYWSLAASKLVELIIKQATDEFITPNLGEAFCPISYNINRVICEYTRPPQVHKRAFDIEKANDDPLYPYDNPDDPHGDDYNPTMCDRATLYVPRAAIEAYKADPVWGQFERIRAIEDGIPNAASSFLCLPTYTVGNLRYALNETARDSYNASIYKYAGAIVVPNNDKEVKYSGKITVPEKVTINGTEYPVFGFMWLSEYPENESSDLEISLPEGLKVIGFNRNFGGSHNTIKAINIPKTVEYIGAMKYVVPGATVTLPGTIKVVSAAAGIEAEKLVIEDGAQVLGTQILGKTLITCHNKELTIPGSVQLGMLAIDARELESLKITKSKINGASPYLGSLICPNSPSIKKITCEYTVPPETSGGAFGLYHGYDMYERATLYVPEEAIEAYKTAPEWKNFKNILPIEDGVNDVAADDAQVVATEYHDLYGRRLEAPAERSITIRTDVYSDGTRRCTKVLH